MIDQHVGQDRWEKLRRDRWNGSDPKRPFAPGGNCSNAFGGAVVFAQQVVGKLAHLMAERRQGMLAIGFEQGRPEVRFQLLESHRNRGNRSPKAFGGVADVSAIGDGHENTQGLGSEHVGLFQNY
nr:hypothetical protein [Aquicoccus porphyridii]